MRTFGFVVIGLLVILALVGVMWVSAYGSLNSGNQGVKARWADVESTLQRRADLIPNLVSTVKGYAAHEEKVLTEVTEARAKIGQINIGDAATNPEVMQHLQKAQQELSGALSRLIAVSENYPNLKANENFKDLQSQLEGTENRINVARERYNEEARGYNTRVNGFFARMVANSYGFRPAEYFQATAESQKVPEVKF